MEVENLIESFSEFKEVKNIDRETMMHILEDVFKSVLDKKYDEQGNFDVIINATSLGLKNESINFDFSRFFLCFCFPSYFWQFLHIFLKSVWFLSFLMHPESDVY